MHLPSSLCSAPLVANSGHSTALQVFFLERDASGSRDIELAGVGGMAGVADWRAGGHAWKNVATT